MKTQINQLRTGALLSYVNLALGCLIPMFYTPVMLELLGQAEYGLYSLSSSAVSYLTLLTFGFGSTIIRYISKARAENNNAEVRRLFGFFLGLYLVLDLLVVIGGLVIAGNVEPVFKKGLADDELAKVSSLILIMTINTALSFPLSVYSSVIVSYERYLFLRILDILGTIAAPISNLAILYSGYGSVGMAYASCVIQFIILLVNILYCTKKLRILPRFERIGSSLIKEMLGFSVFVFLGTLVDMLFWATDKIILGMLVGSVAVAVYNVGGTFNNIITNLSTSISGVLTPKITGMVIQNASKKELTDLFIRIGRIQYIIIALIASGFIVFGMPFIRIWAGPEYGQAYWVALMTMLPLCIPLIQNTGLSIVIAQNKHRFRSIVYLIIAIVNVIFTYLTVPTMGIIGAAFCSCLSYIAGQGIIMNLYYYKVTGLDIPLFWKNIGKMSIVPAFLLLSGLTLVWFIEIDNWFLFFALVACYTAAYAVLMYLFALNDYEKSVILEPVRKFIKKKAS